MKPQDQKETMFDNETGDAIEDSPMESAPVDPVADSVDLEEETELLRSQLAEALKAAEESHDRYLRERADLENFKKRTQRERVDERRYAVEPLLRDLLPVIDNLERAIDHARDSGEQESVVEGLSLVWKGALEALQRHGASRIDAGGEVFDPAVHEALAQVADESVEPNRIVQQFMAGYRLHDRLLRAAQVSVSAGPATDQEEG